MSILASSILLLRLRICTHCLRHLTLHCEHCLACSSDHTCYTKGN